VRRLDAAFHIFIFVFCDSFGIDHRNMLDEQ